MSGWAVRPVMLRYRRARTAAFSVCCIWQWSYVLLLGQVMVAWTGALTLLRYPTHSVLSCVCFPSLDSMLCLQD